VYRAHRTGGGARGGWGLTRWATGRRSCGRCARQALSRVHLDLNLYVGVYLIADRGAANSRGWGWLRRWAVARPLFIVFIVGAVARQALSRVSPRNRNRVSLIINTRLSLVSHNSNNELLRVASVCTASARPAVGRSCVGARAASISNQSTHIMCSARQPATCAGGREAEAVYVVYDASAAPRAHDAAAPRYGGASAASLPAAAMIIIRQLLYYIYITLPWATGRVGGGGGGTVESVCGIRSIQPPSSSSTHTAHSTRPPPPTPM